MFCKNCGNELNGETYCTKCGNKVVENVDESNNNISKFKLPNITKKYNILIGLACIIVIIILFSIFRTPNLKTLYKKYCQSSYATLADDGSYLLIDTNPYDIEDDFDADANNAIIKINKELGLPDSLIEDMNKTRALDGKQSEDFKKINVTWRYHPDKGLEVIYKKK